MDPTSAARAGRWVQATLLGDDDAANWCRANGLAVSRAMGEGTNTAGGFLVPTEVENSIIALRDLAGVFRAKADVRQMGRDVRHFPRRVGGLTAYFTAEQAALTESNASWDIVTLSAKKLSVLTRVSTELLEDEVVDLGQYFIEEMAYAFADQEDNAGFNGDGTSAYGGIRGLTQALLGKFGAVNAATGHDLFSEIDTLDLQTLMAALPAYAWQNACFYASASGIAQIFVRETIATGGVVQTIGGPRPVLSYLGFPIIPAPKMPSGTGTQVNKVMILFGDLALSSILGSRRGIMISRSANRYLEYDQIGVAATERFDIVNHSLGDATTAGPIVGLVGA